MSGGCPARAAEIDSLTWEGEFYDDPVELHQHLDRDSDLRSSFILVISQADRKHTEDPYYNEARDQSDDRTAWLCLLCIK